jgi:hypothetical protein
MIAIAPEHSSILYFYFFSLSLLSQGSHFFCLGRPASSEALLFSLLRISFYRIFCIIVLRASLLKSLCFSTAISFRLGSLLEALHSLQDFEKSIWLGSAVDWGLAFLIFSLKSIRRLSLKMLALSWICDRKIEFSRIGLE